MRVSILVSAVVFVAVASAEPLEEPGLTVRYVLDGESKPSNVVELTVALGAIERVGDVQRQWFQLDAVKGSGGHLRVWLLCAAFPPKNIKAARKAVARYILQRGDERPTEFRHRVTGEAVLPETGAWPHLFPRAEIKRASDRFPERIEYLGLRYQRVEPTRADVFEPPSDVRVVELRPDVLTGLPLNTRQVDETRRFDGSDYEYIPLTNNDYQTMITAGMNCFAADAQLAPVFDAAGVFYWGVSAGDLAYPDCLYDPRYLGPVLYLDEPAVVTRDHAIRPKLRESPEFRRTITPQDGFAELQNHYEHVIAEGAPTTLIDQLTSRGDIDMGNMHFRQPNLYSWETMVSAGAYELSYDAQTPGAIVFEPPGHVGARRLLPGMNIAYGCQIPVTGTDHFFDIIIGFLRGAARATGKEWGISIYGSVDRSDAFPFLRRAYDLGATRFFYWDCAALACVPFSESLELSRQLSMHARQHPERDLDRLLHAAEVAVLLPPGYNLGHVQMGRGLIWGVPELNLERRNAAGVPYRTVMGNFFTEIERCIRDGVAFDLLWDLENLPLDGYREIVRIREDGKVEVMDNGRTTILDGARVPRRPDGQGPRIALSLSQRRGTVPLAVTATARVIEGDAPVYFSPQPDDEGVHHNKWVAWELYGPNEEDYGFRGPAIVPSGIQSRADGAHVIEATIQLKKLGTYRLRATTTDLAGRTDIVWKKIVARNP